MTRKIAIIITRDYCPGYGDDGYETLLHSISDWEEVSEEDFKILTDAQWKMNFRVLEQPTEPPKFIAKTVDDWKKLVKEEAAREKKLKEEAAKKALEKKLKKELRAKETKKQLLARLKAELGEE